MILTEVLLFEAQNYEGMFSDELRWMIGEYLHSAVDSPTEEIQQSKKILKRNDRIVWYLREMRLQYLRALTEVLNESTYELAETNNLRELLTNEFKRIKTKYTIDTIHDLETEYGVHGDHEVDDMENLIYTFDHFLSMDIRKINDYTFKYQTPTDIITYFDEIEQAEGDELKGQPVSKGEDATEFLKLREHWIWFDLGKAYCSDEGGAMAHCGNSTAQNDENKTILSLREKKGSKWLPHLTFIYLKAEKALGEMKGVSNSKPTEKYHKYIIPLLEDDRIQILAGGGYKSQNNFKLSDLDDATAARIAKDKPMMTYNSETGTG